MAEKGLRARTPRAARYSSYADEEGRAAAPSLLLVNADRDRHDFSAAAGGGFTLHSDRGWHYHAPDRVRACGEAGVERSMSRKGRSPDNAACDGFFGRLKASGSFTGGTGARSPPSGSPSS